MTSRSDLPVEDRSPALPPRTGPSELVSYEKVFCAELASGILDLRGLDREDGSLALVRPDQQVANLLPATPTASVSESSTEY